MSWSQTTTLKGFQRKNMSEKEKKSSGKSSDWSTSSQNTTDFINFVRKELVEMIFKGEIDGKEMEIFLKIIGKWKEHDI